MKGLLVRLGALLLACHAPGAWEQWPGPPLSEEVDFPPALRSLQPIACAQNPATGEIVVGDSRRILVFDGAVWRAQGESDRMPYFRAFAFSPDGETLWAGGSNEVGLFRRGADGEYRYESLLVHLPEQHRALLLWASHAHAAGADFVEQQRILRWDGTRFQIWEFPTAHRLFPVLFEGALWFTHLESGLYRLDASGPTLVAPRGELPERAPMWLSRREGKLVAWSSSGITTIGPVRQTVSSPDLTAAMSEGNLAAVAELPDGHVALGTLQRGLLIANAEGQLVQSIPSLDDGRKSAFWALLRDRDGDLWAAIEGKVIRLPAAGLVQGFRHNLSGTGSGAGQIASDAARVWVLGDREILTFHRPDSNSSPTGFTRTGFSTLKPLSLHSSPSGLLLTAHGEIAQVTAGGITRLFEFPSRTITALDRLRPGGELLATRESHRVALLQPRSDGAWERRDFARANGTATSIAMDAQGTLWFGEVNGHATRYAIEGDELRDITPPELRAQADSSPSVVVAVGEALWIIQRRQTWRVLSDGRLERVPLVAPAGFWMATASPRGSRIYLALDRWEQGTRAPRGLGIIELDRDGAFSGWSEPWVPGLETIGRIAGIHVTTEPDATERLWLVGPEGLLNFRVEDIAPWPAPQAPLLAATLQPAGKASALPFEGHAVSIRVQSPEIARRAELRFETRLLRGGKGDWSAAATQGQFDFSNLTDGSYRFEARAVTPAGQVSAPVAFSFAVLPPWYRTGWAYVGYAALTLAVMIGAVRHRERRVRARNAELERLVAQRTSELEQANAAKDEFLASMSHEIRNPMNGVVGLSSAIDPTPLDPDGRHRFELLRHCANHLAILLEDILDFSRLQSGQLDLHEDVFSPAELLESVEAITAAESAAAGMPVQTALAPNLPAHLRGDARRLRQILLNFVANALKYAGRGRVEVAAWARPLGQDRFELTLSVSDQGPGIPPEEQGRVFTKFERGSAARQARIAGTGMGLAVCRQLAEHLGGRVWLESTPGQGCTFFVAVPLAGAAAPEASPFPAPITQPGPARSALVVDDEEYNRLAHAAQLERLGFAVQVAADGASACALMTATRCDVVLLDYDMPDVKGPELARRLRALTADARVFLIAVTAYTTVEKRTECLAAGMDAFLGKPITEVRLREVLAELVPQLSATRQTPEHAMAVAETSAFYGAVSNENLRDVARRKGQTLSATCEVFARDFAAEMAQLHEAIVHRRATAASLAHQLSGRLGFVRAAEAAQLALDLEETIRTQRWEETSALETRLATEWEQVRAQFSLWSDDPVA